MLDKGQYYKITNYNTQMSRDQKVTITCVEKKKKKRLRCTIKLLLKHVGMPLHVSLSFFTPLFSLPLKPVSSHTCLPPTDPHVGCIPVCKPSTPHPSTQK